MLVRCENGHFFDPKKHPTCPYCAPAAIDVAKRDLHLHVHTPDGVTSVEVSPDVNLGKFLDDLREPLHLRSKDAEGHRVWWHIYDREDRRLDPNKTLGENGVGEGHDLYFREEFARSPGEPKAEMRDEPRIGHKLKGDDRVLMRCDNGHYFDPKRHAACPYCDVVAAAPGGYPGILSDQGPSVGAWAPIGMGGSRRSSRNLPSLTVATTEGSRSTSKASVQFATYCPAEIQVGVWADLLVYMSVPEAFEAVRNDSRRRLGVKQRNYRQGLSRGLNLIERGTEVMVVPVLPGCRFNPLRASVQWLEDWHRTEFRVEADANLPGFESSVPVTGCVSFYVGPILVAEVKIWTGIVENQDSMGDEPGTWEEAEPYQAIFVSYAREDTPIVEKLEKAYGALGMQYLRDVRTLRSGEGWDAALLKKIEEADLFQLCWSRKAKSSPAVEREWRHALRRHRSYFIRPLYWEQPMPQPPPELSDIHFAPLEW